MIPREKIKPLNSYLDSVESIMRLSKDYCRDMRVITLGKDDFEIFYTRVCNLKYIEDSEVGSGEYERLWRAKWIMERLEGADCKKKSILIASFCNLHGIPVRFIVMSNRRDKQPHHIYTEVKLKGRWVVADATYPQNRLGKKYKETFRKVFRYE